MTSAFTCLNNNSKDDGNVPQLTSVYKKEKPSWSLHYVQYVGTKWKQWIPFPTFLWVIKLHLWTGLMSHHLMEAEGFISEAIKRGSGLHIMLHTFQAEPLKC